MLYQAENPHGGDRYGRAVELDFSVNTNPLGTPPAVRRAAASAAGRMDRYPDPFCRELTEAMARSEGVPREHILFGNGAAELIFTYCAALRPRRALELAPTFSEYAAALTAWGCQVDRLPLRREEGFVPGPDLLDRLRRERYDVLFLCNPNNPTGRLMDPALLREVLALCRERETRLFVDECFLDLSGGAETGSLKPFLAQYPGLFILKAFTKNYAMAGLRLGCGLTADGDLLTAMGRLSQPWNVSLPAQAAGLTALEEREFSGAGPAAHRPGAVVPPPGPGAPGAGGLPLPGQLPALLRPLPPVPAPAGPGYPDPGLRQLPRPGPRLVPRRRETPPGKPSPAGGDRRGS